MKFNKRLALLLAATTTLNILPISAQTNLDDYHWANNYIQEFYSKGYISGYKDSSFLPDRQMTRYEFITLVNKVFGFTGNSKIPFSDVSKDSWGYKQLEIAISNGYISGYEDNTFRGDNPISRAEVCVILSKLYKIDEKEEQTTEDLKDVPKWAQKSVKSLVKAGIITGYTDSKLDISQNITRAETVVMLKKAQEFDEKIKSESAKQQNDLKDSNIAQVQIEKKQETIQNQPKPEMKVSSSTGGGGGGGGGGSSSSSKPTTSTNNSKEIVKENSDASKKDDIANNKEIEDNKTSKVSEIEKNKENTENEVKTEKSEDIKKDIKQKDDISNEQEIENNKKIEDEKEELQKKLDSEQKEKDKLQNDDTKATTPPILNIDTTTPQVLEPKPLPIPETEEEKAQKILEELKEGENKNVVQYKYEDGSIRTIIWVKGINPPTMSVDNSGDFIKEVTGNQVVYQTDYKPNSKWYDVNKSKYGDQRDSLLCFGAVSANQLHWWLEQNEEYVSRFIKQQEKLGAYNNIEKNTNKDINRFINSFKDQQESNIFELYKLYFGAGLRETYTDLLNDMFINGYIPDYGGRTNYMKELKSDQVDSRGGFFYKVFGSTRLTERKSYGAYKEAYGMFGNEIKSHMMKGDIIGLAYYIDSTKNASHIVTIWGAEYDVNNNIMAVYISDSDDQKEGTNVGMKRIGITKGTRERNFEVKFNSDIKNVNAGASIRHIETLSLGQDKWEEYFIKNPD